jgi:hypothetical protein
MKKSVVVLKFSKLPIPQKIAKARSIVLALTGNANFISPTPALTVITTLINDLETAYLAAQNGGTNDTANMHTKEFLLESSLKLLLAYIESIANTNLLTAETVALSSGFDLKSPTVRGAKGFSVKPTGNPGEVKLSTNRTGRASVLWQMSKDPLDALGWSIIGHTSLASFIKDGLISGVRYYFRVSSATKDGQDHWSDVINTIVL